jgi:hypothetical protein
MRDWLDEILNPEPEPKRTMVSPGYRPSPPSEWGSGRRPDPLTEPEAAAETATPETPAHLREEAETPKLVKVPPKPSEPPVSVVAEEATETEETPETDEESGEAEGDEETKGRIRSAIDKARAVRNTTAEKIGKVKKPVGEKMEKARNEADPKQARKWGLLWSTVASWVVAPGTLGALYDRGVDMFGSWTDSFPRAAYLDAGGQPQSWDFFEGPAYWVKETFGAAWEAGLTEDVAASMGVGVLPVIALTRFYTNDGGLWGLCVKAARWFAVLGVAYYVSFEWFPQWWEVYFSALSATAIYGWMMAKRIPPGFWGFVLRIPMAALVSGMILYSPGAVF